MLMSKETALKFFGDAFGGEHHIPSKNGSPAIEECGQGWCVFVHKALSTYDPDDLTHLVILAHSYLIRVEISGAGKKGMRIAIHQRANSGRFSERHPTTQALVEMLRED